jgi:hypothetical protein
MTKEVNDDGGDLMQKGNQQYHVSWPLTPPSQSIPFDHLHQAFRHNGGDDDGKTKGSSHQSLGSLIG